LVPERHDARILSPGRARRAAEDTFKMRTPESRESSCWRGRSALSSRTFRRTDRRATAATLTGVAGLPTIAMDLLRERKHHSDDSEHDQDPLPLGTHCLISLAVNEYRST
jgi:hypothetical protein